MSGSFSKIFLDVRNNEKLGNLKDRMSFRVYLIGAWRVFEPPRHCGIRSRQITDYLGGNFLFHFIVIKHELFRSLFVAKK